MADLRIFTYLPNPRLYKATIAARFSGAEIEVVGAAPAELPDWLWDFDARALSDDEKAGLSSIARTSAAGFGGRTLYKSDAFLKAHPFGTVPAAFSGDGAIGIFESNAIMRAAARAGEHGQRLFGEGAMVQSRVDSYLDRTLIFARDAQRYLLARERLSPDLHGETQTSLTGFLTGLERSLADSPFIAGNQLTLADIAVVCELSLFSNEDKLSDRLQEIGRNPLLPALRDYERLGAYLDLIAEDERFGADLAPYFRKLRRART